MNWTKIKAFFSDALTIAGGTLVVFTAIFFLGFTIGKRSVPEPAINTETVVVVDSTGYQLADSIANYYDLRINALEGQISAFKPLSGRVDTIYIPTVESVSTALISRDTLEILTDYFSIKEWEWLKQDTNINVVLHTVITQNEPVKYTLDYKILRPSNYITTTVDNSIHYAKYLQLGVGLPTNFITPYKADIKRWDYAGVELQYVYPRGYFGAEYFPFVNVLTIKAGLTLFKFK